MAHKVVHERGVLGKTFCGLRADKVECWPDGPRNLLRRGCKRCARENKRAGHGFIEATRAPADGGKP